MSSYERMKTLAEALPSNGAGVPSHHDAIFLAGCARAWADEGCPGPEDSNPRWTPREIAERLMQRGLMLIYEDRAEIVDIETALREFMGEEG
jgi:hypothetical protein